MKREPIDYIPIMGIILIAVALACLACGCVALRARERERSRELAVSHAVAIGDAYISRQRHAATRRC